MARRKRADYLAPSQRVRPPRPVSPPAPGAPPPVRPSPFPPGTWRTVLVVGTLGALALCAVTAYVVLGNRSERALQRALTDGSCTTDSRTDPLGREHVDDPVYRVDPPAGGTHTAAVARAGVYPEGRVPAQGHLVHALEHGYVVLWHRPEVDPVGLVAVQEAHPEDVIVVERASLPVPVAATAWERRLLCRETEPGVLERFVEAYVGDGPEDVPRG